MDNIQILLGQFKVGMREHGIETSSWVVSRDVFAKIILSKYSELEPRSANRLYSSLDLKYTDQVCGSERCWQVDVVWEIAHSRSARDAVLSI